MAIKDLLIGGVDKLTREEIMVWYKSIRSTGFDGDIVLLVYSEPDELVSEIAADGIFIVKPEVNHMNFKYTIKSQSFGINRLRFYDIWAILTQIESQYRYVITTDVRDVVFQTNPFDWLTNNINASGLVVGSECITYEHSSWNSRNIKENFGPFVYEYLLKDKPVICCGVLAGMSKVIKEVSIAMYLLSTGCPDYADQAALNVMLNTGWSAQVTTLDDAYIAHCAIPFELQYASERKFITSTLPQWKSGLLYDGSADRLFSIVHQYNRIPGAMDILKGKYNI